MNPITPSALNDACDEIAAALLTAYPQNTWMVVVDPEAFPAGGYGFLVMTRPVNAAPEPDGKAPVTISARPRLNDLLKGMRFVRELVIPGLIKAFAIHPEHVPPAVPRYYFALWEKPDTGNKRGVLTFRFTQEHYFKEHRHLDDRGATEAAQYLPAEFQRIMDSTYTFKGQLGEAEHILRHLGWDDPADFVTFVNKPSQLQRQQAKTAKTKKVKP